MEHGFPAIYIPNFVRMGIALSKGAGLLVTVSWLSYLQSYLRFHSIPSFFLLKRLELNNFFNGKKGKESHTIFQSYRNHPERNRIKQEGLTNITWNAYSGKSADQPETNPGSRLNHSRAITMKRTKVTISWYLWENSNPFVYLLSQDICRNSLSYWQSNLSRTLNAVKTRWLCVNNLRESAQLEKDLTPLWVFGFFSLYLVNFR